MVLVIIAGICLPINIYLFVSIEYELSEKKTYNVSLGDKSFNYCCYISLWSSYFKIN